MYLEETSVQVTRKTGVKLKEYEIRLLEQLMIHRILHSKSIHEFIREMAGWDINKNVITNRLHRLLEVKILDRVSTNVSLTSARFPRFYYKLGVYAYRILIVTNRLHNTAENFKRFKLSRKSVVPSLHTDAISKHANQIYLDCLLNANLAVEHYRGAEIKLLNGEKELLDIKTYSVVVPDWVFILKKKVVFLELDTGSQNQQVIKEKVRKYQELIDKHYLPNGYEVTLIFTVLDDSIDVIQKNKIANRDKRVASLKKNIALYPLENFSVFALAANRTSSLVRSVFLIETQKHYEVLSDWFNDVQITLERVNQTKAKLISIGTLDSNQNEIEQSTFVIQFLKNGKERYILPVFIFEGEVKTHYLLQVVINNVPSFKSYLESSQIDIFLVYPSYKQATDDVLGITTDIQIYKTDLNSWREGLDIPMMIKVTGPFKEKVIYKKAGNENGR